MAFVTTADGGTGLTDFDPDWDPDTGATYAAAIATATAAADGTPISYVLWHGGERDASDATTTQAEYFAGLIKMTDAFSRDLPGGPRTIVSTIHDVPTGSYPARDEVVAAQLQSWSYGSVMPGPDLRGITTMPDSVHVTTEVETTAQASRWADVIPAKVNGFTLADIAETVLSAAQATPIEANIVQVAGETATATGPIDFDNLATLGSGSSLETNDIIAGVLAGISAITLSFDSQPKPTDSAVLEVARGDDYTDQPTNINITSDADLSAFKLVVAAKPQTASGNEFALRMSILGDTGNQYSVFNPPSSMTKNWESGEYELRYRIEYAANKLHTIKHGQLVVTPFDTPDTITDLN